MAVFSVGDPARAAALTAGGAGTAVAVVLGTARFVDALGAISHHSRHNRHSCTEGH